MFSSRDDYARVVKLLLAAVHGATGGVGPNYDEDADGNPRVYWTDHELAEADRYRLDVTTRPGTYDGRVPPLLELRLLHDDAWYPDEDDASYHERHGTEPT